MSSAYTKLHTPYTKLHSYLTYEFVYNLKEYIVDNSLGLFMLFEANDFREIMSEFINEYYNHEWSYKYNSWELFENLDFQETMTIISNCQDFYDEFDTKLTFDCQETFILKYKYYYANDLLRKFEEGDFESFESNEEIEGNIISNFKKLYKIYHYHRKYDKLKNLAFKLQIKTDLDKTKLSTNLINSILEKI